VWGFLKALAVMFLSGVGLASTVSGWKSFHGEFEIAVGVAMMVGAFLLYRKWSAR